MVRQPVQKKSSEFNPTVFHLKIDFVSYSAHSKGVVKTVTRKYDTLIHLLAVDYGSKQESADNSSKQELQYWQWERSSLSPTLSIITRWYGHGKTPLSISHVCVSGEAEPSTMIGTEEEPAKKINTWWNFKLQK